MSKICSAQEAVSVVKSGDAVASVGVIGWITPDALLKALAERFKTSAEPRDVTFYFPCGTGDAMGLRGMDHVAVEGLMNRVVSGWIREGSFRYREDVTEGLACAPEAFCRLMRGGNFGKALVQVAPESL